MSRLDPSQVRGCLDAWIRSARRSIGFYEVAGEIELWTVGFRGAQRPEDERLAVETGNFDLDLPVTNEDRHDLVCFTAIAARRDGDRLDAGGDHSGTDDVHALGARISECRVAMFAG